MKASFFTTFCLLTLTWTAPSFGLPADKNSQECPSTPFQFSNPVLIPDLRGLIVNGDVGCISSSSNPWGEGVFFNQLDVSGDTEALREALEKRFLHKPFSKNDIGDLKQIIVDEYVRWGYPLVDVFIPPQDITDGILQIGVIESKLNEVRVSGNYWFGQNCLRQYLQAEEGRPIDYNLVTSDLYWINRNPFRRASIVFTPGANPGSTDLEVMVDERFPLRVYAGADNRGTEPVGRNRGFVGFNWGNAFGLDHILSFQFTGSDHFDRLKGYAASYDAPLPWQHNLYIYGGYAQVKVKHIDGFFVNKGRNYQFSTRYEVPLSDYDPSMYHGFQVGFDFKKTNNNVTFSDTPVFSHEVELTQGVFEYWYQTQKKWGEVWVALDFIFSPFRILHNQTSADYDTLRPGAKPRYYYLNGEVEGTYNLPFEMSFVTRAKFQWTNETLLPSEEFWLGGFDTVRGYFERVVDADSGAILNLELYSPPFSPVKFLELNCFKSCEFCEKLLFLVFFDYGTASNSRRASANEEPNRYLMGVGPGLRYYVDDHLEIRADWGFQLHKYREHKGKGNVLNFSVLVAF